MTTTSWRRAALLAGFLAAALVGCEEQPASSSSSGSSTSSGGGQKASYTIGVIAKSQSNPVFQAARVGAQDGARELGEQLGIDIRIDWRTPNVEDPQQQAQYVEQLVAAGVDGIAISCTDANLLTSAINDAVDKGVFVVTFDSDAPASKRMAYYGVDDKAAGAEVMKQLSGVMGGKGVVAILAGNQNASNLQARVAGVREEAAKHPDITVLDTYYHPETAPDAAAKMQSVQTANPEVSGWALVGGWPLYTDNALDGIYENAKVVSLDPLPLPLDYVKKGQVQVLIGQPYHGWGYESVRILIDKLHNHKDPANPMVYATFDIVTEKNADEYLTNWKKWAP